MTTQQLPAQAATPEQAAREKAAKDARVFEALFLAAIVVVMFAGHTRGFRNWR